MPTEGPLTGGRMVPCNPADAAERIALSHRTSTSTTESGETVEWTADTDQPATPPSSDGSPRLTTPDHGRPLSVDQCPTSAHLTDSGCSTSRDVGDVLARAISPGGLQAAGFLQG